MQLLVCKSGKEKISVSKSDALNVSAVASACEESYRTGLPVQLSLGSGGFGDVDLGKGAVNGEVIDGVISSSTIVPVL